MKIYIIKLILIGIIFTSCDNYLEEPPIKNSNIVIETTEDLDNLLNNYTNFYQTRDVTSAFGTDNNDIPVEWYDQDQGGFSTYLPFFLWSVDDMAQSSYSPWQQEYSKIAYANTVLENLKKVQGTDAKKEALKLEAHFVRAYSNFELATIYCLPFSENNKNALGLPLKKTMDYEESLTRASLEDTFKFIEADLEEALKTNKSKGDAWRFSLPAVNAFAARYYLYKHDYNKAKKHSIEALKDYDILVNTANLVDPQRSYTTYYLNESKDTVWVDILRPEIFWSRTIKAMHHEELYYTRFLNIVQRYIPSQELIDLYEEDDLRKGYLMEYFSLFYTDSPNYSAFAHFNYSQQALQGPTTSEMLLIKAECQIREGSIAEGMNTLEILRMQRFNQETYTTLEIPGSILDALSTIIDERRRENPFVWRWYDIKRLNTDPDNILPPIEITRSFYPYTNGNASVGSSLIPYTLSPKDKRFAIPIPVSDIILSNGEIEQNNY